MAEVCTTINCCLETDIFPVVPDTGEFLLELSASPVEGGTVDGAGLYGALTVTTITATPETGYDFVGWFDGNGFLVSALAEYEFQMTANFNWEARFEVE